MDKVQIFLRLRKGCRAVKTGVVHPLVGYNNRALHFREMGNGVLRQNCKIVGANQLRYTVVNFRIGVIRTTGKDDSSVSGLLHPHQGFFSLFLYISSRLKKLFPSKMGGISNFLFRKIPFLKLLADFFNRPVSSRLHGILNLLRVHKNLCELIREDFFVRKGEEGLHKENALLLEIFHIVFNVFRIGSNHGAVIVIASSGGLISFIGNTGVENEFLSLVD